MIDAPVLYGINSCDTVRKARRWLKDHDIGYRFHDLRGDGIDIATIRSWLTETDVSTLLNRRSTTWKQLDQAEREIAAGPGVVELLVRRPTLIKRPVLVAGTAVMVGFSESRYATLFASQA